MDLKHYPTSLQVNPLMECLVPPQFPLKNVFSDALPNAVIELTFSFACLVFRGMLSTALHAPLHISIRPHSTIFPLHLVLY